MGFHFAGFALGKSKYPADWPWYHDTFLGAGQYASNTWRPTPAVLRVEERHHPATRHLPDTFRSAPNEWYRWSRNLRENPDIEVLLSIDSTSFPLGTGPKPHEIWYSDDYPVVWTNKRYRMLYLNVGHNDIDYEHKYGPDNGTLSRTLDNVMMQRLVVDGLLWLGSRNRERVRRHAGLSASGLRLSALGSRQTSGSPVVSSQADSRRTDSRRAPRDRPYGIPVLLTNARRRLSGDQDGTLIVP